MAVFTAPSQPFVLALITGHQTVTAPPTPSGGSSSGGVFLYDSSLPPGTIGTPYSQSLTGGGGTAPYTFALASGSSLPSGLSLSISGTISGTPTATGASSFTVAITDANGATGSQGFTITVNPASTPTVSGNYGYAS